MKAAQQFKKQTGHTLAEARQSAAWYAMNQNPRATSDEAYDLLTNAPTHSLAYQWKAWADCMVGNQRKLWNDTLESVRIIKGFAK